MSNQIFLIAEVGQAHDGSLGILHSYIDALSKTGVDGVKFQTHIAEAESSIHEPFRINFSYEDDSRFDYWKRMGFTKEQWIGIKEHCDEVGLEFISSPFSQAAVDLLERLDVRRYKIGSGEVNNFLMLEKIGRTKKPIILSSGMSSFDELDAAINFLRPFQNEVSILQCTTSYPTPAEKVGLNVIEEMRERYPGRSIGLSEHTGKIYTGLAAAALGVDILEFHAVFDRRMFGPDASSSLTIDEIRILVEGIRFIEIMRSNPIEKQNVSAFTDLKKIFEKSLAVSKNLAKGHIINFDDLEAKKPSDRGIPANQFRSVIGTPLQIPKKKFDFLRWEDISTDGTQ